MGLVSEKQYGAIFELLLQCRDRLQIRESDVSSPLRQRAGLSNSTRTFHHLSLSSLPLLKMCLSGYRAIETLQLLLEDLM